jgi:hypothetical protein
VAVDQSTVGVYEAETYAAMMALLQRALAKKEAAAAEQERQILEAHAIAAALAFAPRPAPLAVDSVEACAMRNRGGASEADGGDDACCGDDSTRAASSTSVPPRPRTPFVVDLRMPRGYSCSAVVDGELTHWGDKHPDIVPVFDVGEHTVCDLTVSLSQCGTVHWSGELSLTSAFTLSDVIELAPGEVGVYVGARSKPAYGEALNRPATVTLVNIRPPGGVAISHFVERLEEIADLSGRFVEYDAESARWSFVIESP